LAATLGEVPVNKCKRMLMARRPENCGKIFVGMDKLRQIKILCGNAHAELCVVKLCVV
jgi:hypothetical protein